MSTTETIELYTCKKKKGIIMSRIFYERIRKSILSLLVEESDGVIVINQLIEFTLLKLKNEFPLISPWDILQVKIDLQERNIIIITFDLKRRQFIHINRRHRGVINNILSNES